MVDVCIASTKRAVTRFKIEATFRHFAKNAPMFCKRFGGFLATLPRGRTVWLEVDGRLADLGVEAAKDANALIF
jgi:hypothetical protein